MQKAISNCIYFGEQVNLDADLIKLIGYFEKKTGATVKDCFYDTLGKLTFVVGKGDLGKALGKKAANLRELEKRLDRKVRISEFSDERGQLIRNLVAPLKLVDLEEREDGLVILKGGDEKTNGLLIGKQARNLRNLEWMVRRYHEVEEIKVV